jgi:hypothetical protein
MAFDAAFGLNPTEKTIIANETEKAMYWNFGSPFHTCWALIRNAWELR